MNVQTINSRSFRAFQNFSAKTSYIRNFSQVETLIGNTPLLVIHFKFRGQQRTIFAKAKQLSGQIRDFIEDIF